MIKTNFPLAGETAMSDFNDRIENLDLTLFDNIESQSVPADKESLLACQFAVRELRNEYNYLEIGSYLGGSIQPYLPDDRCRKVYSIDKRPLRQPDERGVDFQYKNNSTARMLELLCEAAPGMTEKITTFDGDTATVDPAQIPEKIQLCFIDGEHTDEAATRDFKFCLEVLDDDGLIVFHDAAVTYNGIADCVEFLKIRQIKFRAYNLPTMVFAIEIGDFPVHKSPPVLERLLNNHVGYLFSLQSNDHYRQFTNKAPFKLYRRFMTWRKGLNKFD